MKRKVIFGAVITALICVCIALNVKILEPTDFTGAWYRTGDGVLYIFEDGIIECADKEIIMLDNAVFSGAYSFAKDKAAIFVIDDHGVGEVVELYLVHKPDGDVLCERKDGNELIWFCRNREPIHTVIDK
ncbi:MAG: hypothetical protein IJE78_09570 [Bacteroidaceae bacterium]|nr:hypothetical protein [Bacteroidaceae bacterium]